MRERRPNGRPEATGHDSLRPDRPMRLRCPAARCGRGTKRRTAGLWPRRPGPSAGAAAATRPIGVDRCGAARFEFAREVPPGRGSTASCARQLVAAIVVARRRCGTRCSFRDAIASRHRGPHPARRPGSHAIIAALVGSPNYTPFPSRRARYRCNRWRRRARRDITVPRGIPAMAAMSL